MSKYVIFVVVYHRHKLSDLVNRYNLSYFSMYVSEGQDSYLGEIASTRIVT
jgi:hypothetical protein